MSGLCGRSPDKKAGSAPGDTIPAELENMSRSGIAHASDSPASALKPRDITDADFQTVITSEPRPVMVDFWAPWCGPCRQLAPTIEQLAADYSDKAVIAKLNTQIHQQTPSRLGIRGIPTIIIFKDGKEVERLVGMQPKRAYQKALDKHLP